MPRHWRRIIPPCFTRYYWTSRNVRSVGDALCALPLVGRWFLWRRAYRIQGEVDHSMLVWEDALNDGHRDANASTALVPHGYWSLGDNHGEWNVELVVQTPELEVVGFDYMDTFPTRDAAIAYAQRIEDSHA